MKPTEDNPKGYWESVEFMQLHDRILASAGSRWNDWSAFNPDWIDSSVAPAFRESLVPLLEREYGDAPLVLLKDPRVSRFFPIWLEALEGTAYLPKVVIPIRHPREVAGSLAVRNHFGRHRSLLLWLRHMLDAEFASRGLQRSFVSYEALLDDWQPQARKIADDLDLHWPAFSGDSIAKIDEFLSSELRHHAVPRDAASSEEFATWADTAYKCLLAVAQGCAPDGWMTRLDGIRAEFDRTSGIYAAVVREHETRVEGLYAEKKAQLAEKTKLAETLEHERDRGAVELRRIRHLHDRTQSLNEARKAKQRELIKQVESVRARAVRSLARVEARAAATEATLSRQLDELRTHLESERASRDAETLAAASQLSALETQLTTQQTEARAAIDAKQGELDALRASHTMDVTSLESNLKEAMGRAGALEEELGVAEAARQEAVASIEERFRETAKLTEIVFKLESSIAELEAARASRDAEHAARLSSVEQELAEERQAHADHARKHARDSALAEFELSLRRRQVALLEVRLAEWAATAHGYRDALGTVRDSKAGRLLRGVLPAPGLPSEPETSSDIGHAVWLVRQSDLFDESWYRATHLGPGDEGVDPVVHYLRVGALLGFNPGPGFDTVGYLLRYPDVRRSGANPLVHFLEHGTKEGRSAVAVGTSDA